MKKQLTRRGCRTLAILWTLAAASIAVAFVRRLAQFPLPLLLLLAVSVLIAANFWRSYRGMEEDTSFPDPFHTPPKFTSDPVLFDDDPPGSPHPNQDSEENTHE